MDILGGDVHYNLQALAGPIARALRDAFGMDVNLGKDLVQGGVVGGITGLVGPTATLTAIKTAEVVKKAVLDFKGMVKDAVTPAKKDLKGDK